MICDWIAAHMPWLVEHIGGAPLGLQLGFALVLFAVLVAPYALLCRIASSQHGARGAHRPRRTHGARLLSFHTCGSQEEPYQDWMDYERWAEDEQIP